MSAIHWASCQRKIWPLRYHCKGVRALTYGQLAKKKYFLAEDNKPGGSEKTSITRSMVNQTKKDPSGLQRYGSTLHQMKGTTVTSKPTRIL